MQIRDLEAFENVPFLVWVKDEDWCYLWGNRAISALENGLTSWTVDASSSVFHS